MRQRNEVAIIIGIILGVTGYVVKIINAIGKKKKGNFTCLIKPPPLYKYTLFYIRNVDKLWRLVILRFIIFYHIARHMCLSELWLRGSLTLRRRPTRS